MERLLSELENFPSDVGPDFTAGWSDLVESLAGAFEGLQSTPSLAAAFLRAEWEELSNLATAMDGEPPPEEVAERFRRACEAATDVERVRAVAGALREAARGIRERGDLYPLQELAWPPAPVAPLELPHLPEGEPALPMQPVERLQPTRPAATPEAPEPALVGSAPAVAPPRPLSVLLVAEPTLRRDFLARQLAACGFAVQPADNSREAVHWLSQGRYQAVLAEPGLLTADLSWRAEHAGVSRLLRLVPGGAFGGATNQPDDLGTPPSEEEIERLRRSF